MSDNIWIWNQTMFNIYKLWKFKVNLKLYIFSLLNNICYWILLYTRDNKFQSMPNNIFFSYLFERWRCSTGTHGECKPNHGIHINTRGVTYESALQVNRSVRARNPPATDPALRDSLSDSNSWLWLAECAHCC